MSSNPTLKSTLFSSTSIVAIGLGRSVPMIEMLACEGIADFTFIDPDSVAIENIGQSAYTYASLNKAKVNETARRIFAIQPNAAVRTYRQRDQNVANLDRLVANADLVINSADSLDNCIFIDRLCLKHGTDVLTIRSTGDSAQHFIAGTLSDRVSDCGCTRCRFKTAFDKLEAGYHPPPSFRSHRVIAERLNVNAAWVALGLLHYRADSSDPLADIGRAFVADPCWVGLNAVDPKSGMIFPMRAYREQLPDGWRCPVCGRSEPPIGASRQPPSGVSASALKEGATEGGSHG